MGDGQKKVCQQLLFYSGDLEKRRHGSIKSKTGSKDHAQQDLQFAAAPLCPAAAVFRQDREAG